MKLRYACTTAIVALDSCIQWMGAVHWSHLLLQPRNQDISRKCQRCRFRALSGMHDTACFFLSVLFDTAEAIACQSSNTKTTSIRSKHNAFSSALNKLIPNYKTPTNMLDPKYADFACPLRPLCLTNVLDANSNVPVIYTYWLNRIRAANYWTNESYSAVFVIIVIIAS